MTRLGNAQPELVARAFHDHYERLAPEYGYKTREDSAVAWEDVPGPNRSLMVATARAVLQDFPLLAAGGTGEREGLLEELQCIADGGTDIEMSSEQVVNNERAAQAQRALDDLEDLFGATLASPSPVSPAGREEQ